MTVTYSAVDNQFGVATGSNVNARDSCSIFDDPPSTCKDLTVTSNDGDASANVFTPGDTYDLEWNGGTIEDATVIRSEPHESSDFSIIVFEGQNAEGETVQVIWSPGYNLEQWYDDNNSPGSDPGFWNVDSDPGADAEFVCFSQEARISVPGGEMPAGELAVGDLVETYDDGARAIEWRGHRNVPGRGASAPVLFAPGAIGNDRPLRLSQQHRVMVTTPRAQLLFGSAEVFVPAKAMVNNRDIKLSPCAVANYVHILLDKHQIIRAEGVLCESLLLGDMALDRISSANGAAQMPGQNEAQMVAARPVLTYKEARVLMADETTGGAVDGAAKELKNRAIPTT